MEKSRKPRGIRNNNPLNIRRSKADWQGLVVGTHYDAEFCQFENMFYGFRAAFKLLFSYYYVYDRHGVYQIISHWAPSTDGNNTQGYIRHCLKYILGKHAGATATNIIMPSPENRPLYLERAGQGDGAHGMWQGHQKTSG